METVLFGSFLTQYDAIKATFKEMKPFLNINEETGRHYYRVIFTLKILFVVYALDRAVQKYSSLIFKLAGKLCNACKNTVLREILPNILATLIIFLLYKEPSTFIPGEFITDICLLIFSLNYVVETYKNEFQKLSSIIFMCLFVQWSITQAAKSEQFRLCTYIQILTLLFLSYLAMMPNNPKYRPRLTYLYILMYIWVFYKLGQHYDRHDYVMNENKIKGALTENRHTELEPERGKLDGRLQNFHINYENICSDIQSSCSTLQNVVPSKAVFPDQEQNNEKLEQVSKHTSFSKSIQNEDTRNAMKSDTSDVKKVKKDGINSVHRTGTLKVHDTEQDQPTVSPKSSVIENEQKTEDTIFKLPKTVYINDESMLDESKNVQIEFKDDEIYKNILFTKNKKTAKSEETHFEELPESGLESTNEASEKEADVIGAISNAVGENKVTEADEVTDNGIEISESGKTSEMRHEATESSDANFKLERAKIFIKKRTIPVLKRLGEMSKAAAIKVKANEFGNKIESNDSAIQNNSRVIIDSGIEISESGKTAGMRHESSESSDANFKPEEKKIFIAKRTIPVLKRQGEISKATASEVKANELGSKVGSNDSAIQKNSRVITASGRQSSARENFKINIAHVGKASQIRIGHDDGTGLQIRSSGASKRRSPIMIKPEKQGEIKPAKILMFKSSKLLLPSKRSKSIVKGRDKFITKDLLAIGKDGSARESEAAE